SHRIALSSEPLREPATAPRSDDDELLPAGGHEVEQPLAQAGQEADGDPVELASYVPALVVRRLRIGMSHWLRQRASSSWRRSCSPTSPVSQCLPSGWLAPGRAVSSSSPSC